MLIMPLHRRMTRANFPVVTFVLVALNVFVFLFLQSGDTAVLKRAAQYYAQSHLGRIEFPAYAQWLRQHDGDPKRQALMRRGPPGLKLALIESDRAFLADLDAGRVIKPTSVGYAAWRTRRVEFERIRNSAFTLGHAMRFTHIEPGRIAWAMFMHGGVMHIVGNMLFLLVLGLLVEGALGPWWFLGLYIVGGFGAAFASLALRWGDPGIALGASGAIASLMGAFCVIWGLRKVRVFYWFFVVFGYIKAPALWLLPVWFGWQVYSLLSEPGAHVAFGAHAGGIVCGAVIAFALRRAGFVRREFIEEDERADQHDHNEAAYNEAMTLIGRLELAAARRLLEGVDAEEPGQWRVLAALYRCARYDGVPAQLDAVAARVLAFPATTPTEVGDVKALYDDYVKACAGHPRIDPTPLLRQVSTWVRLGEAGAAEDVLRSLEANTMNPPALAAAWFALAMHAPETSPERRARLDHLAHHFPHSPYAAKARFLQSEREAPG